MEWAKTHTCSNCKWSWDEGEYQSYLRTSPLSGTPIDEPFHKYTCLWNECSITLNHICKWWEEDEA